MLALVIPVGLVACAHAHRDEAATPDRGAHPVARATFQERQECTTGRPTILELPKHCAWPETHDPAPVLTADVDLVVVLDGDGRPKSARVGRAPEGAAYREAAVACAMRGRYLVPAVLSGAALETCPFTLRLSRYATDLDDEDPTRPCPPALHSPIPFTPGANTGTAPESTLPLRCR